MKDIKYATGDIVYIKVKVKSTGESTKLQYRYRGPYVVIKELPNDTYKVKRLTNNRSTTAHVSEIKIWRGIPDDDKIISDDESDDGFEEIKSDNNNLDNGNQDNESQDIPTNPDNVVNEGKRARKKPAWLDDHI